MRKRTIRKLRKRIRQLERRITALEQPWQPTPPPPAPNLGADPDWTPNTTWRQLCDDYITPTEWIEEEFDELPRHPGPNGYL